MATQTQLNIPESVESIESYQFEPIKGHPMLKLTSHESSAQNLPRED